MAQNEYTTNRKYRHLTREKRTQIVEKTISGHFQSTHCPFPRPSSLLLVLPASLLQRNSRSRIPGLFV